MQFFEEADCSNPRLINWVRNIENYPSSEEIEFKHKHLHCRFRFLRTRNEVKDTIKISYFDKASSELLVKYEQAFGKRSNENDYLENRVISLEFTSANKIAMTPLLTQFLKLFLDHYQLWGTEICVQLHTLCELVDLAALWSAIENKVKRGDIAEAIHDVVKYQTDLLNYETIWRLAQHLSQLLTDSNQNSKIKISDLYKLYEGISEPNPHYAESRFAMQEILMNTPITEENKIFLLENKFKVALQAKQDMEADRLFNELCGKTFSSIPVLQNVRGNVETLCQLAAELRLMQARINELEATANINCVRQNLG